MHLFYITDNNMDEDETFEDDAEEVKRESQEQRDEAGEDLERDNRRALN